jgi:hypothetical protein
MQISGVPLLDRGRHASYQKEMHMHPHVKSISRLAVRLLGVAFGLALALFLFSSVAMGHGLDGGGGGGGWSGQSSWMSVRHERFRHERFRHERFRHERFRRENNLIIVRVNVRVIVVSEQSDRFGCCDFCR